MIREEYRGFTLDVRRQEHMYAVSVHQDEVQLFDSGVIFVIPAEAAEHGMDFIDSVIRDRPLEDEARAVIAARRAGLTVGVKIADAADTVIQEELGAVSPATDKKRKGGTDGAAA